MKSRILLLLFIMLASFSIVIPNAAAQTCDPDTDHMAAAGIALQQGNYDQAIASYNCALTLGQAGAEAYNRRGIVYRQMGDYPSAIADYTQAIALSPRAIYYNNRGWTYYLAGDKVAALADYNAAIDIDPDLAYAYNNRGLLYYIQGDYEAALADFDQAIALGIEPMDWAVDNRNNVLTAMGQATPAAPTSAPASATAVPQTTDAETQAAPTAEPTTAAPTVPPTVAAPETDSEDRTYFEAYQEAIDAYREGDYETSTSAFAEATNLDPTNAEAYFQRAYTFMVLGSYDYSLRDFTHAIEMGRSDGYIFRAYVNLQLGNREAAIQDYESAGHTGNWIEYPYYLFMYGALQADVSADDAPTSEEWFAMFDPAIEQPPLVYGETNRLQMDNNQMFLYAFEGSANSRITIIASSPNLNVDPLIALFDPEGTLIAFNDDSDLGFDAMIEDLTLTMDGTYTLAVTHAGGGATGRVEVLLTEGGE